MLGGCGAAPVMKGQEAMASPLRSVAFERSGGLYHQPIGGAVRFDSGTAELHSDFTGGGRPLTADERQMFERLDVAALAGSPYDLAHGAGRPGPADGYQYDVGLEAADGHKIGLRFHEEPAETLDKAAPGLGSLAAWVRREIAELWRQKANAPRPPG